MQQERNILWILDEMSRSANPQKKYNFDLLKIISKILSTHGNHLYIKGAKHCWEVIRKRIKDNIADQDDVANDPDWANQVRIKIFRAHTLHQTVKSRFA